MLRIYQDNRELRSFRVRPGRLNLKLCSSAEAYFPIHKLAPWGLVEAMGINSVMGQRSA